MNPRYFVTYKNSETGQEHTPSDSLGRFHDSLTAERRARERYDGFGFEVVSVRPETRYEAAEYKVTRFVVRSVRIAVALVIGFFAYAWLDNSGTSIGDTPLNSLTINMLLSGLFRIAAGIGAAWFCWTLAFGEGPQE